MLWVDAPAGAFRFLQKHCLICLSVYKSCIPRGRSRRGFLFPSKRQFYFEVYEASTLPAETFPRPESKIHRAERPPFFLFWSESEYPYSAKFSSNFVQFPADVLYVLGGPLKVAGGRPRRLGEYFVMIVDGFGSALGVPGGALWGSFFLKRTFFKPFVVICFRTLKKE